MENETKTFSLRITEPKSDRDNGIGDLRELLDWMTMDSSFTHQLGRFADECKPHLFRLFPELGLASACLPKLDNWLEKSQDMPETGIRMWLTELQMLFPEIKKEYAIPQIPLGHTVKNPIEELAEIAPHLEIVHVVTSKSKAWPDYIEV